MCFTSVKSNQMKHWINVGTFKKKLCVNTNVKKTLQREFGRVAFIAMFKNWVTTSLYYPSVCIVSFNSFSWICNGTLGPNCLLTLSLPSNLECSKSVIYFSHYLLLYPNLCHLKIPSVMIFFFFFPQDPC